MGDKVLLPEFGGTKLNLDDKVWKHLWMNDDMKNLLFFGTCRHFIIFDEWSWNCRGEVLAMQLERHGLEFYPSHCRVEPADKFSSN